jgi:CSLREA domain-containing protein
MASVLALLGGIALPTGMVRSAGGLTFIVNTTTDAVDATPGDGKCLTTAGACSLRAALMEANAARFSSTTLSPFTINLPGGKYELTVTGLPEDEAAAGDLDIRVPMQIVNSSGGEVIIEGVGSSTAKWTERIFEINLDVVSGEVQLTGLQIVGGVATSSTPAFGGGIYAHGAGLKKLILTNGNVANNKAVLGGGIYNGSNSSSSSDTSNSALSLVNSSVNGNQAIGTAIIDTSIQCSTDPGVTGTPSGGTVAAGGGIYVRTSAATRVDHSTLSNNASTHFGGGVEVLSPNASTGGQLNLVDSTVSDNSSQLGGGIFASQSLSLDSSTVSGNSSQGDAGGLIAGGQLCGTSLQATLTNSTVSGNTAVRNGGGIVNNAKAMELHNVTVAANTAGSSGGGIFNQNGGSTLGLANTIIGTNTLSSGSASDCAGHVSSEGFNLIGNSSGCTIGGTTTGNIVNANPRLGPLQDNGGSTHTQALLGPAIFCPPLGGQCLPLLPPSPAIDAGNPATPSNTTAGACATEDQRGIGRPIDGNGDGTPRCDMGAYEAPAGTSLGTFALTLPDGTIPIGKHKTIAFSWTVPAGQGWRSLDSLQLMLRDDKGTALWLRFHEVTGGPGTFSLVNPADYSVGPEYAPGSPNQLTSEAAVVYLATSSVDGPPGQTVTLTLDVSFKPEAAGRAFDVLVMAVSDAVQAEGLVPAGRLMVPAGGSAPVPQHTPGASIPPATGTPAPNVSALATTSTSAPTITATPAMAITKPPTPAASATGTPGTNTSSR